MRSAAYLRCEHALEQLHGGPLIGVLQEENVEAAVEDIGSGAEAAAHHIQVQVEEEGVEHAAHLLSPWQLCL